MFSLSKDKIDKEYASIKAKLKIEDDGELKKYLGIELYHHPDGSIHLRQPYLTQIILNMITGMDRSSAKPTPAVNPLYQKMSDLKQEQINLIIDQ